ncbi:unnamed protein product [Arctogadus glacialis]
MEFSEHIRTANVENVVLRQPCHPSTKGTLCITGHHLIFSDRESQSCRQVLLLLRNIDAIEKSVESLLGNSGLLSSARWKERAGIHMSEKDDNQGRQRGATSKPPTERNHQGEETDPPIKEDGKKC